MSESSGSASPGVSPQALRPSTRMNVPRKGPDCRPKGDAFARVHGCVLDRPGFVAPICMCVAGGHGGLNARLGASIVFKS
jgi:hypothetical protein